MTDSLESSLRIHYHCINMLSWSLPSSIKLYKMKSLLYCILVTIASASAVGSPVRVKVDTPPAIKPIEEMSFKELLDEGRYALNNVAAINMMHSNPDVVRLQKVFTALSKTLPFVTYDKSIGPIERGADGLIHEILHPMTTAQDTLDVARSSISHPLSSRGPYHILTLLLIVFMLYILVGSIIMSKYYDARGTDRIPHMSFWLGYPGLVADGFNYLKQLIGSPVTSPSYQRIAVIASNKHHGSRDMFSNFEPI